jgi:hypothetical protein
LPRITDAFVPYTYFVVILALLFGGGARQGLWSDVLVQLAALPLFPWAIFRLAAIKVGWLGRTAILLLCLIVILPLAQLIPLPPELWTALPGRAPILAAFKTAGIELPWLPLSLDPASTWQALLSLIPAVVIFLAMLPFGQQARRVLVAVVLAVVFISVPLDMMQIMGGQESPLRFYEITNEDRAVGFFANSNHAAAFLYCAIPLAVAWAIEPAGDINERRPSAMLAMWLLLGSVVVGLSLTLSRGGLLLGFVGGLMSLALAFRQSRARNRGRLLLYGVGAILAALLLAFQFGFVGFAQRVESADVITDLRWPVAGVTMRAALAAMPFGTGIGTFVPIYEMFAPASLLRDHYVNHAHDDWLELWLTGGVAAAALVTAFLLWFAAATLMAWRRAAAGPPSQSNTLARAASIVILLLLAHSVIDYPLRTIALEVVLAMCCAMLVPPHRDGREAAPEGEDAELHGNVATNPRIAKY